MASIPFRFSSKPSMRSVWLVAALEWRASMRNWWLILYAALFVLLTAGVSFLSTTELSDLERGQFGRTAATMTNVVMVLIPLFALTAGAASVAPDRERGLLGYFLSHPLTTGELLWGKYLGSMAALTIVLAVGLAAGSVGLAASRVFEVGGFLWLAGLSWLLMLASFSTGVLVSVVSRRSPIAIGLSIVAWVVLLFLGDLGLMAAATMSTIDLRLIVVLAVANPTEAFKVASVDRIGASLDALGPGGQWLAATLDQQLLPVLVTVLLAWAAIPFVVALFALRRTDVG